ncbi:hypothetical protein CICLE_v10005965mg [Citrus x clementina]|uniref:Short-chain dehydrogenase TIC 32, chloroplastic n=1 Tax=Citrus clementina TaxID=85681 RepID=V4U7J7_CITCL|nr:hypothetical protein CICLE_v10005965mg [Citrus x clementina]
MLSPGHFLLTNLLLDTMKRTAQESGREGRIVNVSSEGHRFTYREGIRFEKLNDQSGYGNFVAYGQSKLANILHANELARHLKEEEGVEVTANSLHPGAINTNLFRQEGFVNAIVGFLGKFVFRNVQQAGGGGGGSRGRQQTCYVALHPQVKGKTGLYFNDSNIAQPSPHAVDTELARKLWDFSLDLINRLSQNS